MHLLDIPKTKKNGFTFRQCTLVCLGARGGAVVEALR
jgi:hypothetical protein